jgi:AcrR family transcriptional regulator
VQAPTLYHYFGDRAGLIRAAVDRAFEDYFARKERPSPRRLSAREEVAAGWDQHIAFAQAYPGLYPAMYPLSSQGPTQVERSAGLLRAGFERLAAAGLLNPGITAELATCAVRAALRGVAHAVSSSPHSPNNNVMSILVRDAVIQSLVTGHEKEHNDND